MRWDQVEAEEGGEVGGFWICFEGRALGRFLGGLDVGGETKRGVTGDPKDFGLYTWKDEAAVMKGSRPRQTGSRGKNIPGLELRVRPSWHGPGGVLSTPGEEGQGSRGHLPMKRPGGRGGIFELFPGHVGVRPRETKGGAARVDPAFQEPCHKGAEKPARAGGGQGSRERDLRAFGPDSRRKGARGVPEGGHHRVKARAPCPGWGDLGGPKDRTLGRGGPEPVVQYQGRPPDGRSAALPGAGSGETRGEGPRSPHRSPPHTIRALETAGTWDALFLRRGSEPSPVSQRSRGPLPSQLGAGIQQAYTIQERPDDGHRSQAGVEGNLRGEALSSPRVL